MTGKEKGKGKRSDRWRYNNGHRPRVYLCCVLLTFTEVEHTRQVHPWQTPMTSEEVPLLGAAKIHHSLLTSCRKHRANTPNSMCVYVCVSGCLSVCSFFFSNNLVLKGKLHMCTCNGLQCEYIRVTGEPQFSLA